MTSRHFDLYAAPHLYDLFGKGVDGDEAYFSRLAAGARRVLELATGTGRVTLPMARAGAKVTGIERFERMLEVADARLTQEPAAVRKRVELLVGDMRGFALDRTYPLIVIPFRAFQHLMTTADQRACLESCREHLTRQGRLVINLFDPNLRMLGAGMDINGTAVRKLGEAETAEGRVVAYSSRMACPEEQWFEEDWVYECFGADGSSLWRRSTRFTMRYFYRYEMEHLFELCGLEVEKLEGGFKGQPYRHGGEQVWTVKRAR